MTKIQHRNKIESDLGSAAADLELLNLLDNMESQQHPDLDNLLIIDRMTNERINPNGKPIPIENEFFSGHLLIMIRTCDADEKIAPLHTGGSVFNDQISNYFRTKKRRFEIQLQIKFKKVPLCPMYLSCEFDDWVHYNFLTRTSLGAALRFCHMKNPTFSYSISCKDKGKHEDMISGKYEKPHFAFPIGSSLDRIAITKTDEKPQLGKDIFEDSQARKRRMNGESVEYNTEDTYTFCLWNAHIDFVQWKINLPAIPKFSLSHINSGQPMTVKIYLLEQNNNGRHLQCHMKSLLDVEVNRLGVTSLGSGAKIWIENCLKHDDDKSSIVSFYSTTMGFSPDDINNHSDEKYVEQSCCCIS